MNKIAVFLIIAALMTMGNLPFSKPVAEIVLDASQVTSAVDIEQAIDFVTANGTRPGIVTLDSSKGKFEYTGIDRSINLYHSNITLRSRNRATIANCDDGVFFDDMTVDNILIEGVSIVCQDGHAVNAPFSGRHQHVILRNNYFETGAAPAINILQGEHWAIVNNQVISLGTGIYLNETGNILIRRNSIRANRGVELVNSGYKIRVLNNEITAFWQGVVLSGKTLANKVTGNRFFQIQDAGIVFTDIGTGNKITGNQITCWPEIACTAVKADPVNYKQNKIAGNKIVTSK